MRAGLLTALLLAACAAQPSGPMPGDRPGLDEALRRLPASAAGFSRGITTDMEAAQPGQGRAVDYATDMRNGVAARAAIASVIIYDRGHPALPPDTPPAVIEAQLDEGVRDSTTPAPGKQMAESHRRDLPVAGGAPVRCATLEGSYGRTAMWQQMCVGLAAGRFVKVFVAVPTRQKDLIDMDADGFTQAVVGALRAAPAGR